MHQNRRVVARGVDEIEEFRLRVEELLHAAAAVRVANSIEHAGELRLERAELGDGLRGEGQIALPGPVEGVQLAQTHRERRVEELLLVARRVGLRRVQTLHERYASRGKRRTTRVDQLLPDPLQADVEVVRAARQCVRRDQLLGGAARDFEDLREGLDGAPGGLLDGGEVEEAVGGGREGGELDDDGAGLDGLDPADGALDGVLGEIADAEEDDGEVHGDALPDGDFVGEVEDGAGDHGDGLHELQREELVLRGEAVVQLPGEAVSLDAQDGVELEQHVDGLQIDAAEPQNGEPALERFLDDALHHGLDLFDLVRVQRDDERRVFLLQRHVVVAHVDALDQRVVLPPQRVAHHAVLAVLHQLRQRLRVDLPVLQPRRDLHHHRRLPAVAARAEDPHAPLRGPVGREVQQRRVFQRLQAQHVLLLVRRRADRRGPHRAVHLRDAPEHRRFEREAVRAPRLRGVLEELRALEGVPLLLVERESRVDLQRLHGGREPIDVDERDQIHALPGVLLVVHVDGEPRRVEVRHGRLRAHQHAVRRGENRLALRGQARQLLQERLDGRAQRERRVLPAGNAQSQSRTCRSARGPTAAARSGSGRTRSSCEPRGSSRAAPSTVPRSSFGTRRPGWPRSLENSPAFWNRRGSWRLSLSK